MERIVETPYEPIKIIEKQETIPAFEKEQVQLTGIAYYPPDVN